MHITPMQYVIAAIANAQASGLTSLIYSPQRNTPPQHSNSTAP